MRELVTRPRVIVMGPGDRASVAEAARQLRPEIERHCEIVHWDLDFSEDPALCDAELAIVLGGDGSILRAARRMGYCQAPVLAVNLGKLGFLADLLPRDLPAVLPKLAQGDYRVVEHLMFECRVVRGGQNWRQGLALNEVAVLAGPPFATLQVDLYVDRELATTYSCDGLIVSTPVGSTAHNLSAGGPILRKDLQAVVISPISPHTLTIRPVVDAADRLYEIEVPRPNPGTSVVVDGEVLCGLEAGDRIAVERSEATFKLIEVAGRTYYRTLREKLRWGGSLPPV